MSDSLSQKTKEQERSEIDIWLLRKNLKLSYEERVKQHDRLRDCIKQLQIIGQRHRAKAS